VGQVRRVIPFILLFAAVAGCSLLAPRATQELAPPDHSWLDFIVALGADIEAAVTWVVRTFL